MAKRMKANILNRIKRQNRATTLIVSIALLLIFVIGGTLAFVAIRSSTVKNTFEASQVICSVSDEGIVTNQSTIKAYVRAAVAVNWMDANGNVYGIKPTATFTTPANSKWILIDDIYYYTEALEPGETTNMPPVIVTVTGEAPSAQYVQSIEFVAEAIQAEGTTDETDIAAVENAWGIDVPFDN